MNEITEEIKEAQDQAIDQMSIGMVFAAKKIKRYHDILVLAGVPQDIIRIELTAWCTGESRLQVEPMIHHIFAEQHAMGGAKEAQQEEPKS